VSRRTLGVLAVVLLLVAVGGLWAAVDGQDPEPGAAPAATATTTTSTGATSSSAPVRGKPGAGGLGDSYFPGLGNGGYDVDHYTLDLTWRADDGELDGVATIEATTTQDLSRFNLDLSGLEVRGVTVDGKPADATRDGAELVVTPAATIADGGTFTTVVVYGGRPTPVTDGTDLFDVGWQTNGREAYVVSEPTGASTFFPVNDHPRDKATYTFNVTVPADQVVAANGLLTGQDDLGHGTMTWTYEARDPMASYLVQIAIGDYELVDAGEVDGVVLRHAFHRSLAAEARVATERTAEMVEVLAEVFGPYPFEAYGVVAVEAGLTVALETQTLTIIGSTVAEAGRGADITLAHELAHQWVGNSVSLSSWKDIWLNEGFATYSQWLFTERTGGTSAADWARSYAGANSFDDPPGDPGSQELFTGTVYIRGGMTLQALRERIGDAAFFTLLRAWVDEHRGGTASTEDFIALAERISDQDLGELFQTWLYDEGLPEL
jgi:aminopeptidase N